jgi:hypothetical protein
LGSDLMKPAAHSRRGSQRDVDAIDDHLVAVNARQAHVRRHRIAHRVQRPRLNDSELPPLKLFAVRMFQWPLDIVAFRGDDE